MTTKIKIKREHIAEYAIGKWGSDYNNPITIPDSYDLYHAVWDLLAPRPANCHIDCGNLEIKIPTKKTEIIDGIKIGKYPEKFNYLSERSAEIIERKIETVMVAELHELMDENKHKFGIEYAETAYQFLMKYQIKSIKEDALIKNYYRWRRTIKRKKQQRAYTKA